MNNGIRRTQKAQQGPGSQATNHLPVLNHPTANNLIGYKNQSGVKTYWDNAITPVFRWYSEMQNREILSTASTSPTFNAVSGVVQPSAKDVSSIDALAFHDSESKEITLFVINRNKEQNLEVTLSLPF